MSMVQVVHLSLGDFKQKPVIPTVQNDTNRVLKMIVDDFMLTNEMTGKLAFKRSDGTFYETAAEINLYDNSFSAVLDQALTQQGETLAQLKISNGTLVSSLGFIIFVEQDTSGVVTPQEGVSLEQAITQCEQVANQAQEMLNTGRGLAQYWKQYTDPSMSAALIARARTYPATFPEPDVGDITFTKSGVILQVTSTADLFIRYKVIGNLLTDTTLSISKQPADAKAVGDAIMELQESIAELKQAITQEG